MTRSELEIIIKKRVAIVVTLFAALLAINTMVAGSNSSKVLSGTIASNNLWSWYQAKNVRSIIFLTTADTTEDKKLAQYYHSEVQRLRGDMEDLAAQAKSIEQERDQAKSRSPFFTYAGSLLQIGIVLSTAAILAVAMPLFWASIVVGAFGAGFFLHGFFLV